MKVVYLVRHAKAIPADVGVEDRKRPLSKEGARYAHDMGLYLRQKDISADLFISSPADRALETAHIFAQALDYPFQQILLKDEIYANQPATITHIITQLDETVQSVMLFGHNPSFSEVARHFLPDFKPDLHPGGVVGIAFDTETWPAITSFPARLAFFEVPVFITKKIRKKARKLMRARIAAALESLFNDIEPGIAGQVEKTVQKTGKRLAKKVIKALDASKIKHLADCTKEQQEPQTEAARPLVPNAESVQESAPETASPTRRSSAKSRRAKTATRSTEPTRRKSAAT